MVMVAGEITTQAKLDYEKARVGRDGRTAISPTSLEGPWGSTVETCQVVRGVVAQIGFDSPLAGSLVIRYTNIYCMINPFEFI